MCTLFRIRGNGHRGEEDRGGQDGIKTPIPHCPNKWRVAVSQRVRSCGWGGGGRKMSIPLT